MPQMLQPEMDDAAYSALLAKPYADAAELEVIEMLLDRPSKARAAVAVRCTNGLPAVLRCDPRDIEGKPFPTMFWLCVPLAASRIGTMEASGVMTTMTQQLVDDADFARRYQDSTARFLAARDKLPGGPIPGNPTQGGMSHRVKCLHALYAHYLATGDNPVGEWVHNQMALPCHEQCREGAA